MPERRYSDKRSTCKIQVITYPHNDAISGIGRKIIQVNIRIPDKRLMVLCYSDDLAAHHICYNL